MAGAKPVPMNYYYYYYYYGSTALCWTLPLFRFLILHTHTDGKSPIQNTNTEQTKISMPRVGIEPMTPVFEWAKRVHAIYSAATAIGWTTEYRNKKNPCNWPLRLSLFIDNRLTG
jgi:hypothetical protein